MIGFASDAIVRDLPRAEIVKRGLPLIWFGELQLDLICTSLIAGTLTIPKGMLTDGASIPHLLWNMLSDTDPDILYPSYAHDYIYLLQGLLPNITLTSHQADQVIREQMIAIGAPLWKADTVFNVLRAHNGNGWGGSRPRVQVMSAMRPEQ